MIKEEAIVLSINGRFATVQAEEKTACGSCSAKQFCGEGSGGKRVVEAINTAGARVGQKVVLELQSSSLVISSTIVFCLPLVLLLIGTFFGYFIGMSMGSKQTGENLGVLGAVLSVVISFFLIRYISKGLDKKDQFYPEIKDIVEE